jgi:hypothetical protein
VSPEGWLAHGVFDISLKKTDKEGGERWMDQEKNGKELCCYSVFCLYP